MADKRIYNLSELITFNTTYFLNVDKPGESESLKLSGQKLLEFFNSEGYLKSLIDDVTPQAGGNLNLNNNRLLESKGDNITSTANITVGEDGNIFKIIGTNDLQRINKSNWTNGSEITLFFLNSLKIINEVSYFGDYKPISLAKGLNYITKSNDRLVLKLIDDVWYEINNLTKNDRRGNVEPVSESGTFISFSRSLETTNYSINYRCYNLSNENIECEIPISGKLETGFTVNPAENGYFEYNVTLFE